MSIGQGTIQCSKTTNPSPYIAITKEKAPRLLYTRRPPKSSWVWGPFPNAGAAKNGCPTYEKTFWIEGLRGIVAPKDVSQCTLGCVVVPCIDDSDYDTTVRHARVSLWMEKLVRTH